MSSDDEKCSLCGASVKTGNLRGHYERVHPKRRPQQNQPKPTTLVGAAIESIHRRHRRKNILILSVIVVALIGSSVVLAQQLELMVPMHIHPRISATINGTPFTIPAQIGIDPLLWKDHSLDGYSGMPSMPAMGMQGMSPTHTHDDSGTIHVESNGKRGDFTLRDFLAVWGKSIDATQVLGHTVDPGHRAYIIVDGVEKIPSSEVIFVDGQQIQLLCGP